MEYVKTLLNNYSAFINFENEKTIKEETDTLTIITSFPFKSLCTKNGKQFYLLGVSYWAAIHDTNISQRTYFLLFKPSAANIHSNFLYNKDNFDKGSLFTRAINETNRATCDPILFVYPAMEYKKKYNETPIFLSLMDQEQINKIHDKFQEDFQQYL